jgi:deazaflavin-dependent oxidoreductase (nitroreductase family)
MFDNRITQALKRERTIDITTIGRKSGQPRRIEIWFYRAAERIYLSGGPGRRSWYANLLANPDFTFHLKGSVRANLPARATPVTDPGERRSVFTMILNDMHMSDKLEAWVAGSPLMEVNFIQEGSREK